MADNKKQRIVILGAASAMAEHTARLLAAEGAKLVLAGRDLQRLESIAADLSVRGAAMAVPDALDLACVENPDALLDGYACRLGGLDAVLIFYGILGDQQEAERNTGALNDIVRVNFTSAAALSIAAGRILEAGDSPRPLLLAIGSVAGDRGRSSNYIYGAAKAGLAAIFEGLAHKNAKSRVRVVLVKSGLVITPMTAGFDHQGLLWARPPKMAAIIRAAMNRESGVVYAPWFWRLIMLVIRALPQTVMNRLDI